MYRLTRDVLVQTTGFSRSANLEIGKGEIRNEKLWQAWIDEGVVVFIPDEAAKNQEVKINEAPLPKDSGASFEKKDAQLYEMSIEELIHMARRMKIRNPHKMKRETLIRKIEDSS